MLGTLKQKLETAMAESVYNVVELIGTSTDSWEKATKAAVERAAKSLRDSGCPSLFTTRCLLLAATYVRVGSGAAVRLAEL
jgi:hypothetical protein